ncbi:DNA repair protein, partial [Vibrio parahaemolyticus]
MKRIALLFDMFALLSGCSSMSPAQCQTAERYRVGYQDGRSGNKPKILYEYIKDCRAADVTPNHVEWQER